MRFVTGVFVLRKIWIDIWEHIRVKNHSNVTIAKSVLLSRVILANISWWFTRGIIRNHTIVKFVLNHSLLARILIGIRYLTLGKSPSNVTIVRNILLKSIIWRSILGSIQVRDHSYATFAVKNFKLYQIWKCTRLFIQVKNLLIVNFAEKNSPKKVLLLGTRKYTLKKNCTIVIYVGKSLFLRTVFDITISSIVVIGHSDVIYVEEVSRKKLS